MGIEGLGQFVDLRRGGVGGGLARKSGSVFEGGRGEGRYPNAHYDSDLKILQYIRLHLGIT